MWTHMVLIGPHMLCRNVGEDTVAVEVPEVAGSGDGMGAMDVEAPSIQQDPAGTSAGGGAGGGGKSGVATKARKGKKDRKEGEAIDGSSEKRKVSKKQGVAAEVPAKKEAKKKKKAPSKFVEEPMEDDVDVVEVPERPSQAAALFDDESDEEETGALGGGKKKKGFSDENAKWLKAKAGDDWGGEGSGEGSDEGMDDDEFDEDSEGEMDVEKKSRKLDAQRAKEEKEAEAELQTNIEDTTEIFELPTEEVGATTIPTTVLDSGTQSSPSASEVTALIALVPLCVLRLLTSPQATIAGR